MPKRNGQLEWSLLAYLVDRDVSPEDVCRAVGLNATRIREGNPLTPKQSNDLWVQASKACHDPLLGLHLGESLQLAALGVVGEIVKYSRTVGEALASAASLTPTLTDLLEVHVRKTRRYVYVDIRPNLPLTFAHQQTVDLVMAFVMHELDGLLLTKIVPMAVHHPGPLTGEYTRVFRCAPVSKGGAYALLLDPSAWDIPILTADFQMQKTLLEKVRADTAFAAASFRDRIYRHLLSSAYRGILSQAEVAANLNMSARSLQRRLKEENATFNELSEMARKALALHYLDAGRYPLKEISDMLGYNEFSAFSRAFKRWTGQAPTMYKKNAAPRGGVLSV